MAYVPQKSYEYRCDCGYRGPCPEDDYCPECGDSYSSQNLKTLDPEFWSVAAFETDRAYGGPEEGGWHYTCGNRIDKTLRCFENYGEACVYADGLAERFESQRDVKIYGYADRVAPSEFPSSKPRYS